jgi:hypothetical protein
MAAAVDRCLSQPQPGKSAQGPPAVLLIVVPASLGSWPGLPGQIGCELRGVHGMRSGEPLASSADSEAIPTIDFML